MRKRYANRSGNNYKQIEVDENFFKGIACYVDFDSSEKPVIVFNGKSNVCIKKDGYERITLYPKDGTYSISIMYDENKNLIEWYFDIASSVGLTDGIPYQNDLYLDMVILPTKEVFVLDEDELLSAYNNGEITKSLLDHAYKTLEYLKEKYVSDFSELDKLTKHVYDIIKMGDTYGSK